MKTDYKILEYFKISHRGFTLTSINSSVLNLGHIVLRCDVLYSYIIIVVHTCTEKQTMECFLFLYIISTSCALNTSTCVCALLWSSLISNTICITLYWVGGCWWYLKSVDVIVIFKAPLAMAMADDCVLSGCRCINDG